MPAQQIFIQKCALAVKGVFPGKDWTCGDTLNLPSPPAPVASGKRWFAVNQVIVAGATPLRLAGPQRLRGCCPPFPGKETEAPELRQKIHGRSANQMI